METETMANPEADANTVPQEAVDESIFGSTDNFFADLDREVNGVILDDAEPQPVEAEQVVPGVAHQQQHEQ